MKKLLMILLITMLVDCFASSGVDVGNGTSKTVHIHTKRTYSEADLEKLLSTKVKSLKMNEDISLNTIIASAGCSKKIKIHGIEQEMDYKIENQRIIYKKRYKGIIQVGLSKCKKTSLLPNHIRYDVD